MSAPTQSLTDAKGAKVAAVIPIDESEELMEDLNDLAVVAERRDESRVSFDEVKRRWKEAGRLPSWIPQLCRPGLVSLRPAGDRESGCGD